MKKGGFTLPGEAGYESLTLQLAERFGADVIRDSDGTDLSSEITEAGYGIYSTICIIRDHNAWAAEHDSRLQQTFLMTEPVTAVEFPAGVHLMADFFHEQFMVNDDPDAVEYWQVMDRTTEDEVPSDQWFYDKENCRVVIRDGVLFHQYTVSFLAYRIWEEISMYNHVTNGWQKEHLKPIDPRHPQAQEYLLSWLDQWCKEHPAATVVRFTSLFYNFVWMWGSSERKRHLFTDWGSYDFTVSPLALREFESVYGYRLSAEDFINQGKFHVTHMPAGKRQMDYMEFTQTFVREFGKKLVNMAHSYGKQAYVFYDDSWVGLEPYNGCFGEYGFDGLIKCVFSGFEARLCAGADVEVHELRLHPYLFPVGLGGAPTFCEGGNPARDAQEYWIHVRRAILREKIERIGLGGYLHLAEQFPDFCSCMEHIAEEFRQVKSLHDEGEAAVLPVRVAVLHTWGRLRSWTLSGHFHETCMHDLIHINEALSGLPVQTTFIDFDDVKSGCLTEVDVLINAGAAGTAWSGGSAWEDAEVVEYISKFAWEGGVVIGVNQPSAVEGYSSYYRLASILGVDEDTGARVCHGCWEYELETIEGLIPDGADTGGWAAGQTRGEIDGGQRDDGRRCSGRRYLTDGKAVVLAEREGNPLLTLHEYGKGMGIYMQSFRFSPENARLLLNLMLYGRKLDLIQNYVPDHALLEAAWFPASRCLVVVNNSNRRIEGRILTGQGEVRVTLEKYETRLIKR